MNANDSKELLLNEYSKQFQALNKVEKFLSPGITPCESVVSPQDFCQYSGAQVIADSTASRMFYHETNREAQLPPSGPSRDSATANAAVLEGGLLGLL